MNSKKRYLPFALIVAGIVLVVAGALILLYNSSGKSGHNSEQNTPTKAESTSQSAKNSQDGQGEQTHTDEEESEVLLNEGNAQQEAGLRSALAEALPFTEGDDKVCAIAYLGEGGENVEHNLAAFLQTYVPDTYQEYLDSLSAIDYGGAECYLIIPRYQECSMTLNCLEMTDEGRFQSKRTDIITDKAFLLYCNPSELYANTEISIKYGEQTFVIMPRISAVDGHVEQMQVALDLTQEQVYQIP